MNSEHEETSSRSTPVSSAQLFFPTPSESGDASGAAQSAVKMEAESPSTSKDEAICVICSDKATGKHYGAVSCDGCKGFFRRTVRKRHIYVCRYSQSCVVDKDHRNTCRRCRFNVCLQRGMKQEAVQAERDRIAKPNLKHAESEPALAELMKAELKVRQLRSSVITRNPEARLEGKEATTIDVTDSMTQQLLLMVEWAKEIEAFKQLPKDFALEMLRQFSSRHLVLCAAFRSIPTKNAVYLTNETKLLRGSSKVPDINNVVQRILDQLTVPMRQLEVNELEYIALKAIMCFNPFIPKATEANESVSNFRQQILTEFERQYPDPPRGAPRRPSQLLLLLPTVTSIARDLIEDVQLAKLFGLASIDSVMTEMMLPGECHDKNSHSPNEPPINHYMTDPSPHNSQYGPV